MNEKDYSVIWLEAEDYYEGTVPRKLITGEAKASKGKYVVAIQHKGYWLSYSFLIGEDGWFKYDVWLRFANLCPSSLFNFYINGKLFAREKEIPVTESWGPPFEWCKVGTINLAKGNHELKLEFVAGNLHPDVLVLTRDSDFIKNGTAEKRIKGEETAISKKIRPETENRLWIETCPRNGIPLGGIGSGKVELCPDGIFSNITFNNNQDAPIYNAPGFFLGYTERVGRRKTSLVLQKNSPYGFKTVSKIKYNSRFPFVEIAYLDPSISAALKLEGFSPIIPYSTRESSIPGAIFNFTIRNPGDKPLTAGLLFSLENLLNCGGWPQETESGEKNILPVKHRGYFAWNNRSGNFQEIKRGNNLSGLGFKTSGEHKGRISCGEYSLACCLDQTKVTVLPSWNVETEAQKMWAEFAGSGEFTLNNGSSSRTGKEGKYHPAGALAALVRIEPGEKRNVVFILSWYMPYLKDSKGNDWGLAYTNCFPDSWAVAQHLFQNRKELREKTKELPKVIDRSSLPTWLKQKLMDDMFPLVTNSWYTRDGKFSINEAPSMMHGCLGTMDQRLCSHSIYTLFYPDLDRTELKLFAEWQQSDGLIPHDLGHGTFSKKDCTKAIWPDIASSFIMQVYKYYLCTGDKKFFKEMYPHLKSALLWEKELDEDGDGVPDLKPGRGTTYDAYVWHGLSAFVGSLWLAALKCGERAAELARDKQLSNLCKDTFTKAQVSIIKYLWNGKYFKNFYDPRHQDKGSANCVISQLAGQWFAHLIDEGYILPREMVKKSLLSIKQMNVEKPGLISPNDETSPEGRLEWSGVSFLQYDEVYYGCLAIYNGLVREGLKCFEKIYRVSYQINKHPWKTHLTYFAKNGKAVGLPWYMTNPASWFILNALAGFHYDMVRGIITLNPHLLPGGKELRIPLFTSLFWLWLEFREEKYEKIFALKFLKKSSSEPLPKFTQFNTYLKPHLKVEKITMAGYRVKDFFWFPQTGQLSFKKEILISEMPLEIKIQLNSQQA